MKEYSGTVQYSDLLLSLTEENFKKIVYYALKKPNSANHSIENLIKEILHSNNFRNIRSKSGNIQYQELEKQVHLLKEVSKHQPIGHLIIKILKEIYFISEEENIQIDTSIFFFLFLFLFFIFLFLFLFFF